MSDLAGRLHGDRVCSDGDVLHLHDRLGNARAPRRARTQPPPAFVFLFPVIWLFWMGGWVVNLILGIVYGIKANQGEWAGYPIIGRLLLREYNPAALSHPSAPQI